MPSILSTSSGGMPEFQSAPGFSAGRCAGVGTGSGADLGFNPLPAFQPGDARAATPAARPAGVSIRSRLFSREMRRNPFFLRALGRRFNPLPAFQPGDAGKWRLTGIEGISFNPLPAFQPGDARYTTPITRRRGFQSAPGFSAGRCYGPAKSDSWHSQFQSAPGFSAGRCMHRVCDRVPRTRFQSAPGFSAGRCLGDVLVRILLGVVSIRSRLFSREMQRRHRPASYLGGVSIRSRLFSREMQQMGVPGIPTEVFQSAPGFSAGRCNARRCSRRARPSFNPLPAFQPGDAEICLPGP